jgi:hypothetical protein
MVCTLSMSICLDLNVLTSVQNEARANGDEAGPADENMDSSEGDEDFDPEKKRECVGLLACRLGCHV